MSKILIIEDEESIAELEKDYLELSGFEVEIESRGDTGLARALPPHTVVPYRNIPKKDYPKNTDA